MLRRPLFGIPWPGQLPDLRDLLRGKPVAPDDPAEFRDAAIAHRLTGFADAAIRTGRLRLPDPFARQLQDAHAVAAVRSAMLRRELLRIAPPLAEGCGAEPLVIKGPAVAEALYEPRTLRPFADLDLLVPRSKLEAAVDTLARLGYRANLHLRPGFAERYRHDIHFSRRQGDRTLGIDLHWRISDDPLGTELAHDRIEVAPLEIDGARMASPGPADRLLVLSTHFLTDRLRRLLWIEDVRRAALAADESQWLETFERADEKGLSWVLHRALDYAAHHLGLARERPRPPEPPPAWGPLRAIERFQFAAAWDLGHLTSIPWRERPGYLRATLLPSREGLRGAAADPEGPTWRLALGRMRRAFRSARTGSR